MKYYFHLREDGDLAEDDEGLELLNDLAAQSEAEAWARELLDSIKACKRSRARRRLRYRR
jgi:hypothetical protein